MCACVFVKIVTIDYRGSRAWVDMSEALHSNPQQYTVSHCVNTLCLLASILARVTFTDVAKYGWVWQIMCAFQHIHGKLMTWPPVCAVYCHIKEPVPHCTLLVTYCLEMHPEGQICQIITATTLCARYMEVRRPCIPPEYFAMFWDNILHVNSNLSLVARCFLYF